MIASLRMLLVIALAFFATGCAGSFSVFPGAVEGLRRGNVRTTEGRYKRVPDRFDAKVITRRESDYRIMLRDDGHGHAFARVILDEEVGDARDAGWRDARISFDEHDAATMQDGMLLVRQEDGILAHYPLALVERVEIKDLHIRDLKIGFGIGGGVVGLAAVVTSTLVLIAAASKRLTTD